MPTTKTNTKSRNTRSSSAKPHAHGNARSFVEPPNSRRSRKTHPNSLKLLWKLLPQAARKVGQPKEEIRQAWTEEWLGYVPSWGKLSNTEATILINELYLVIDPDNLNARLALNNLEDKISEMLIEGIIAMRWLPKADYGKDAWEEHVQGISFDKFGDLAPHWRQLAVPDLRQLHMTVKGWANNN